MCYSTQKSLSITDNRDDGPPAVLDGLLYELPLGNCWPAPVDRQEKAFKRLVVFPKAPTFHEQITNSVRVPRSGFR